MRGSGDDFDQLAAGLNTPRRQDRSRLPPGRICVRMEHHRPGVSPPLGGGASTPGP